MSRAGWIRLCVVLSALLALEAACRLGLVSRMAVIPPTAMAEGAWRALASAELRGEMLLTLLTVALALVLSVVAGIAGGIVLSTSQRAEAC